MSTVIEADSATINAAEDVAPGGIADALRPLVSALSMLIYHADQVSPDDDPRDPNSDAAQLLSDAEAVVYGLAKAPSTDYFWQVASTSTRAALSLIHRTLQQALDKPEGLGLAQMAMLPAAITLAGRLVAVLDLVDPDEQMEAVRELETSLRTGALGGSAPAGTEANDPAQDILGELHELVCDYADGWPFDESESFYAVAYLCEVARAHVAAGAKHPDKAEDLLEEASLTLARVKAILAVISRSVGSKAIGGFQRLVAAAHLEVGKLLDVARKRH